MAVLYALRRPGIRLEAVTTTQGNTNVAQATANTLQLLALAGRPEIPVATGAARSIAWAYTKEGSKIHGENGIGNVNLPAVQSSPVAEHAVDLLIRMARAHPGELTLVPTGPLTNVALMLLKAPETATLFREMVIMGGAVLCPGNASALAEANIFNDPEAARIVFGSGAKITLVGLDVTMQTLLTPAMVDAVAAKGDPAARAVMAMTRFYLEAYESAYPGIGGCALHDPLAVAIAEDPTLVRTEAMQVEVECGGEHSRGLTFAERRHGRQIESNMKVCLDVDAARFTERFIATLSQS